MNHGSDIIKEQYKYSDLTAKIIGCAITVHKALGNGFTRGKYIFFNCLRECFAFQEVIYQRALEIEMRLAEIDFSREHEMPVYYRDVQIGSRRVDFLVKDITPVEKQQLCHSRS